MGNALNAIDTLAVSKAVKKSVVDKARAELSSGFYSVNTLVRVHGEVTIGEDYEQADTASLPKIKSFLAWAMLNGVCIESALKKMEDESFKPTKEQQAKVDEIWKRIKAPLVKTFNGKVTHTLEAEVVEEPVK